MNGRRSTLPLATLGMVAATGCTGGVSAGGPADAGGASVIDASESSSATSDATVDGARDAIGGDAGSPAAPDATSGDATTPDDVSEAGEDSGPAAINGSCALNDGICTTYFADPSDSVRADQLACNADFGTWTPSVPCATDGSVGYCDYRGTGSNLTTTFYTALPDGGAGYTNNSARRACLTPQPQYTPGVWNTAESPTLSGTCATLPPDLFDGGSPPCVSASGTWTEYSLAVFGGAVTLNSVQCNINEGDLYIDQADFDGDYNIYPSVTGVYAREATCASGTVQDGPGPTTQLIWIKQP